MLYVAQTALELGFQYALVAMALFLSYRVLDIADLTTDGCFVLGCAVSVTLTAAGHPFLAIPAAYPAWTTPAGRGSSWCSPCFPARNRWWSSVRIPESGWARSAWSIPR